MQENKKKTSFLRIPVVQTLLASLLCILLGLAVGYIALLIINPAGASDAIIMVLKNYLKYSRHNMQLKYFGNTLVKTAPLLMCSLSVLFAYKVGLFNIGAAGQYVVGAGASLYCALALKMPWPVCVIAAVIAGAVWGAVSGMLKAYRNVNEVISCIMLNWIGLYLVNMILSGVKNPTGKDTFTLTSTNPSAILPTLGLENLFAGNTYVTIAVPFSVIIAILVWILLDKTRLGYELKATGYNRNAAKYCGMQERRNIILTMAISGALAALGAAMLFLSDFTQWDCNQTSLPGMGFNGIAASFLGGLHPLGTVFASYFIQHITDGGSYVDLTVYCAQISDFISSVVIYLCGFVLFFKLYLNGFLNRRDEKKLRKEEGK